jgi:selenocysteine-specific elongation factor
MLPPTVVIGTAGHIDHGKTALLRTLTGIDADRLQEERSRGMTIDVGYAHLAFEDGVELDFVDVPGHDRLIGNMLVGAGEIDAAMLVVAADDGPRPQTLEHLQLLDALGIADGLAVVTKTDLVDDRRVDEVRRAVRELLAGTSLADAPVVAASAVTGAGIEQLRVALRPVRDRVAAATRPKPGLGPAGPHRLAIDRAFAARGRGVVVTGTLRGSVARGAWLRREPGGELVRVRELQVHGEARDVSAGGRAAFNIGGGVANQLRRGDVLVAGDGSIGEVLGTDRLLARLRPPAAIGDRPGRPPRDRAGLRLHVGTAQVDATLRRVRVADELAVLTLEAPVATFAGDRAVLREPATGAVIAGLRVLDLSPPRGVSRRRMTAARLTALSEAVDAGDLDALGRARLELHGGMPTDRSPAPRREFRSFALADDVRETLGAAALEMVAAHHRVTPLSPGLPLPRARAALLRHLRSLVTVERQHADVAAAAVGQLVDGLVSEGQLARRGDALRDPSLAGELAAGLVEAMDRLERTLDAPAPPPLREAAAVAGCPPEGVRALQADGRIVRLGPDLAWSTGAYHRLAATALERARRAPLTPAALRDATGTSRKYVLAILEDLDRRGILQRTPEGHLPGPRAPSREATRADDAAPTAASGTGS